MLKELNFKKIIFTSDILRVDNREKNRLPNPQSINIDWIYNLFFPSLYSNLPRVPIQKEPGDINFRLEVYKSLDLGFNSSSWAQVYEFISDEKIREKFADLFRSALIISFELPPYLIDIFHEYKIKYIDFSIHPIRFLDDYVLGFRSNIEELYNRANLRILTSKLIEPYVCVSRARSARVYRKRKLVSGAAVFLGQMDIDSSLIYNEKFFGLPELKITLLNLSMQYPRIYYKFHPHLKKKSSILEIINGIRSVEIIDVNIYDLFSAPEISLYSSFSSGSLHEARLFGCKTDRIIPKQKDPFDKEFESPAPKYIPFNESAL